MLERANHGEQIVIMRGNGIYTGIGPPDGGKLPFGLLRQRGLPLPRNKCQPQCSGLLAAVRGLYLEPVAAY